MKLAIIGATGTVGVHLINQSLESGYEVTAFVRTSSKVKIKHPQLSIVQGDVLVDQDTLSEAIRGKDAVLIALGDGAKGGIRAQGTQNIIGAMEKVGVKRLICQSTLGAGESFQNLNWLWRFIFRVPLRKALADHEQQEKYVKESNLDWTIVRPAAFTDGKRSGSYLEGFKSTAKNIKLKISRADVADFMLKQLTQNKYLKGTPALSY